MRKVTVALTLTFVEEFWPEFYARGKFMKYSMFVSNPTTVLRLCCVILGVVTIWPPFWRERATFHKLSNPQPQPQQFCCY